MLAPCMPHIACMPYEWAVVAFIIKSMHILRSKHTQTQTHTQTETHTHTHLHTRFQPEGAVINARTTHAALLALAARSGALMKDHLVLRGNQVRVCGGGGGGG